MDEMMNDCLGCNYTKRALQSGKCDVTLDAHSIQ